MNIRGNTGTTDKDENKRIMNTIMSAMLDAGLSMPEVSITGSTGEIHIAFNYMEVLPYRQAKV